MAPRKTKERLPRLDASGLAGLTSLMNRQHLNPEVDLDGAEKEVMGRGEKPSGKGARAIDPVRIYTQELNVLAEDLEIDFQGSPDASDSEGEAVPKTSPVGAPAVRKPSPPGRGGGIDRKGLSSLVSDLDLSSDSDDDSSGSDDSDAGSSGSDDGSSGSDDSDDGSSSSDDSDDSSSGSDESSGSGSGSDESSDSDESGEESDDSTLADLEKEFGIDLGETRRSSRRRQKIPKIRIRDTGHDRRSGKRRELTDEQEKRHRISAILAEMRKDTHTTFGAESERFEDEKARKLEQIGQLRLGLVEEGINCDNIPEPTIDSDIKEINSALNVLRLKNDRNRYSTMAEEVLLGGAEFVEGVLDGSRRIPLIGWQPDYTGYSSTMNVKLHRMRSETSELVGRIIENHNIGPTTRIALELLPSLLLYPSQRRKERGKPGLHSDPRVQTPNASDARGAYNAIRASDARSRADNLSALADV